MTVTFGPATQIVLSGGASLASGSSETLTATIEDAAGNTVTSGADSSRSVTFNKASGAGAVTGLGASTASGGVATDVITGSTAGAVNLQANATLTQGSTTSNTLTVTVTFGPATQIVLSGSTTSLASGTTRTFTATIEDAAGNTVTSGPDSTDSITFSKTTGAGTVSGLTTVAASGGVATDTVTGNVAGSVTLQASGTVNGSAKNSNTLTFSVTFGSATQIVLSGGSSLVSGSSETLTATIEDAAGNTVTSGTDSSRSVTFAKTTGAGSVTGFGAFTASGGVASDVITGSTAGAVNLTATATLTRDRRRPTP